MQENRFFGRFFLFGGRRMRLSDALRAIGRGYWLLAIGYWLLAKGESNDLKDFRDFKDLKDYTKRHIPYSSSLKITPRRYPIADTRYPIARLRAPTV